MKQYIAESLTGYNETKIFICKGILNPTIAIKELYGFNVTYYDLLFNEYYYARTNSDIFKISPFL